MRLAFIGPMHSGKTTATKILQAHDKGIVRLAFADPVKEISAKMLTEMKREFTNPHYRNTVIAYTRQDMDHLKSRPEIRKLLQLVGTELGRDFFGPKDLWINLFENKLLKEYKTKRVVNDDCRFLNEAARLEALDFTLIYIDRPLEDRYNSVRNGLIHTDPNISDNEIRERWEQILNHPSEQELAQIAPHRIITNDGTNQFKETVLELWREFAK